MTTEKPINLDQYQEAARESLPRMVYDYYAGGSWDEVTLRENVSAYDRIRLRYRVMRDVSRRNLSTRVLGEEIALPILVAPTAFHRLAHEDGEVATARAAGAAGTIMIVSTLSTTPVEAIAEAATGPLWFQLYVYRDRSATRALIERAEAAGCSALVLTVDSQIWGERERDRVNRFHLPEGLQVANLMADMASVPDEAQGSGLGAYVTSLFDQRLRWKDLDWLRSISRLPILVKGLVHPDDARIAVESGVDGIVVSNHGGRQVDTAPATIDVLAEIVDAVDAASAAGSKRCEVILDGGIRRGSDVVKALALGARAVAVGRPVLWGLAVDGQKGVENVFELLRAEFDTVMGLCGNSRPADLSRDLIG